MLFLEIVDGSKLSCRNEYVSSKERDSQDCLVDVIKRPILEQLQNGKLTEFMDKITVPRVTVNISPFPGLYSP